MNKVKTVMLVVAVGLAIVAGVLYAISQQGQTVKQAEKPLVIKIGALYGLTGDLAEYVKGVGKGIEYAVKDFQTEHPDVKIELIIEDDKSCDKAVGVTGIQKLVNVDRVQAVVGVLCSGSVIAVSPIVEQNKVLLMSGSASSKEISKLGDYVFRTYSSDELRAKKVADLLKQRKYKKAAFIYELENDGALTMTEDMIRFLGEGVSQKSHGISFKDLDFKSILTQIRQNNPDVIVFSLVNTNQIIALFKQVKEMGLAMPLIAPNETVQDNKVLEFAGSNGVIYTIFSMDETNSQYIELKGRYEGDTGATEAEVPQYLAENYDGTMIVLQTLYQAKGDTEKAQKLMYEIGKNYQGKSGVITFDANGDVNKMPVLMIVKDGKFAPYQE